MKITVGLKRHVVYYVGCLIINVNYSADLDFRKRIVGIHLVFNRTVSNCTISLFLHFPYFIKTQETKTFHKRKVLRTFHTSTTNIESYYPSQN